jgi:cyclophilin family peptidyl-prolyl cis-trans isomerase
MPLMKFGSVLLTVVSAAVVAGCGGSSTSGSSSSSATAAPATAQTSPTPVPTGTPVPLPEPSSQIPFADCGSVSFGPALGPVNPPANVHEYISAPGMTINTSHLYLVTIATARGNIVLCLQPQLAPTTVNNFVTLARNKFYNGLTFHRVVSGFVVQAGDPLGNGSGGPGYKFNDEPVRGQYVLGALAMANSGPNTNGSQFFIDIADDTAQLQPIYNLFGKVQSGQAVANSIQKGDVMTSVTVQEQQ